MEARLVGWHRWHNWHTLIAGVQIDVEEISAALAVATRAKTQAKREADIDLDAPGL